MKNRSGFVSNSSSCSFVVCGFLVPESSNCGIEGYRTVLEKAFGITEEKIIERMKENKYYKDGIDDPDAVKEFIYEVFSEYRDVDDGIGILDGEGIPGDGVLVGKIICYSGSEDSYMPSEEYDMEEIIEEIKPIREKMGCPEVPIKLYTGTKCC